MTDKVFLCRCEDVTLHDVEEAVRAGNCDLESVKRFTGLGTGWCQGKQCVAVCAAAIHRAGGDVPSFPITPRPPFHPIALADLAALQDAEAAESAHAAQGKGPRR